MDGGYINEGGQLKSKNGQKYIINTRHPDGYYITRTLAICLVMAAVLFTIIVFLLTYFVIAPRCDCETIIPEQVNHHRNNHDNNNNNEIQAAGVLGISPVREPINRTVSNNINSNNNNNNNNSNNDNNNDNKHTNKININKNDKTSDINMSNGIDIEPSPLPADQHHQVSNNDDIILYEGWNPTKYRLIIEPNFETSTNNGSVTIYMENDPKIAGINPIVLDINNIEILDTTVYQVFDNAGSQKITFDSFYGENNQTYQIYLNGYDKSQRTLYLQVNIEFISKLTSTLQGFYRTTYLDEFGGDTKTLASTQFSPIDARRAFPCFDRPDKKAEFEISVITKRDLAATLSNMPSNAKDIVGRDNHYIMNFDVTPKMSTYLVAFITSDLHLSQRSTIDNGRTSIQFWTRKEVADMTKFAHEMTRAILPYLESYFDIRYKLQKIDMVAVPDFGFSAMENWGLITFRESAMLVPEKDDERRSSAEHTERVASIIAHELAHQWFGNLVTMKWWDDLWLKEGFATYMSYEAVNYVQPDWHVMDMFTINELQKSMAKDSDESSHPISFPVSKPSDIRRIFDPISYSKGAAVIRMMNNFLGEQTFKIGIRHYLRTFEYSNAVQDDLWKIMTEIASKRKTLPRNMSIKEIMDSWTLQAGYPVVTVKRNGTDIIVSQHRYMLPEININDNSRWFIPITYATESNPVISTIPTHWLTTDTKEIVISNAFNGNEWLYVNVNRTAYYRVNYDYDLWIILSRKFATLPSLLRAQMIDDSLHLARNELLSYDIPLTFLLRMASDHRDVFAWAAAGNGLDYLTYMLTREPAFESFKSVMRYIVKPAYEHLGFDEKQNESHVELMHRATIIRHACFFGYDRCTNRAQILFREWMRNPKENNIRPNLKNTVYCIALREGGIPEWHFAYKQYKETTSASEKETLLNALGCTTRPWLLAKYLNLTISPESGIRKQDGARAFTSVAKNSVGYEIAFDFLVTNIAKIADYFGDGFSTLSKMVDSVTTYMNKGYNMEQFDRFAKRARELGLTSIERSILLATEQVKNNMFWRSRSYYKLQEFLEKLITDLHINLY